MKGNKTNAHRNEDDHHAGAADLLNVSPAYLAELIESGELNAVRIGSAVCLSSAEVRRYKAVSVKQRKAALDELTKLSQELGLG